MREVVSGLNRLIDSTTSVQCSDGSIGKPGKGLRFCSACAGARRSTLTPCDRASCSLVSCLLTMAHVAHTVRLSAYVCHALRQFGDAKSPHTPLVVQMVDAQSFENCTTDKASDPLHGPREQQAAEEVLVHSDYPARGRATKRLTSCPQLTSHDRTLDDASSSSGRQTEKKMLGSRAGFARPPVCRTLEQSEIWDSNFRVLAPGRESKRSRIFDLQKVYNSILTAPSRVGCERRCCLQEGRTQDWCRENVVPAAHTFRQALLLHFGNTARL